ncbi:hypothetical protein [Saccharopolyspora cebuensis]|uniref:Uncharacterized protein n=1 Tax=Saccharopolyspora cebuensis TaxID=418759 RepID=A0ABV4CSD1_9PSEU
MSEQVRVLKLGIGEFAAEVHEGEQITEHRVVISDRFRDKLLLAEVDEQRLISESLKCLLQQIPVTSLPHDIDLDQMDENYPEFLPELRARLGEQAP